MRIFYTMKAPLTLCFFLVYSILFSQTTNGNGTNWLTGSNWVGGTFPGNYASGSPNTLSFSNQTMNINHPMIVGAYNTTINMSFANSNFAGQFNVADGVTFIVYGSMNFVNKAMDLVIGDNSTMIVMGDFDLGNQIIIASTGRLVVSGDFNKGGTAAQGSYTGDGVVYAGSYSGAADAFIPGDVATGSDQQQVIDDLLDDGFDDIWEFVNGGGQIPLPVELTAFDSKINASGVMLTWQTATELNNDYFDIERSEDGKSFYTIGRVDGNGTTNDVQNYSFTDNMPIASIAYYRLKQVDFDGVFEYSKVIVGYADELASQMQMSTYPNPAVERVSFKSTSPLAFAKLQLINLAGQTIADLSNQVTGYGLNYEVALPSLEKGLYYLQYQTTSGQTGAHKLLIK